jgi:hypothetical protein
MNKYSLILASVLLLATGGFTMAQNQMPSGAPPAAQAKQPSKGMTGTQNNPASSTNPQGATGTTGRATPQTPREVPENGGAPMREAPRH